MNPTKLTALRRSYAEELRVAAPIRNSTAVIEAFAAVPREKFMGRGPWILGPLMASEYRTANADPSWLYHNVLVGLDVRNGINSGQPTLWAFLLDQLDLKRGERVLQVGAGTGYYTAILAAIVGRQGRVLAIEFDKRLYARARRNLKDWPQVEVVRGDASTFDPGEIDAVVVFAGGTHPASIWLQRLVLKGRLLMPIVMDNRWGFMLKVVRQSRNFKASALCRCGFVLAKGFRDKREARNLEKALRPFEGDLPKLRHLHTGRIAPSERSKAVFVGRDYWLSK